MMRRLVVMTGIAAAALVAPSCGPGEIPVLVGESADAVEKGEALYARARAADEAGSQRRALRLYSQVERDYPLAPSAARASFREAQIHEERGDVVKAFDAYQKVITRHQGSGYYSTALERQAAMAQAAADGEVRSSFLGLRSRLALDKTVEMLSAVRDNAPKTRTAARAQFTVGELYQSRKKPREAIEAYRRLVRDQPDSPEAPEALFRVGIVLTEEAERGNQNQATLDQAREAFNDYLIQYPRHARAAEARQFIANLSGRELDRSLGIADFYYRTGQIEAARVYYRDIARRAGSGPAHDTARARLAEMGE